MSRAYRMSVTILESDPKRCESIKEAANGEWDFSDWFKHEGVISAVGESDLGGGESEDNFAAKLARAIFKANGKPCKVEVNATYLDDLPYESYSFDGDDPPPA